MVYKKEKKTAQRKPGFFFLIYLQTYKHLEITYLAIFFLYSFFVFVLFHEQNGCFTPIQWFKDIVNIFQVGSHDRIFLFFLFSSTSKLSNLGSPIINLLQFKK